MRHSIIVLLLCLCRFSAAADYTFRHITSEQGLPHQQVETIVQDNAGNIWIGTRNGLARYDGYDIKSYHYSETDEYSINHNFVHRLMVDRKGNLWVITNRGMCRYRKATDDFLRYDLKGSINSMTETSKGKILCGGDNLYTYDAENDKFTLYPSVNHGAIVSMAVDKKDNVYVATDSIVFCYDSTLTNISHPFANTFDEFLTGADGIVPMLFTHDGAMWVGRNGQGVMRIDSKGNTKIFPASEISNGIVRVITEDRQHNIWLGTEKGITIISKDDKVEILRSEFSNPYTLSDNAIYTVFCDRKENIWVGSYFGGVDILIHKNNQFSYHKPGPLNTNIRGKVARTMVETAPGTYWIATEDGGLNIFDSATGRFEVFNKIPQVGSNVHSLLFDKATNTMWIGTFRNGLFRYNLTTGAAKRYLMSNGHNLNSVFSIAKQKNGKLWIATTLGMFFYNEKTDAFDAMGHNILDYYFVYSLLVDHKDNLWCGTTAFGLFRIDSKTGKITNWNNEGDNPQISDNYITYLFEDSHHRLWFGTNNNGVQYFDPDRNEAHTLSNTIMPEKSCVCAINEDKKGYLWISTSVGLLRYSHERNTMVRFTTEDGLPTNQFNFSSTLLATNGSMLFGTVNGLVSFAPSAIRVKKTELQVHLKALTINNQLMKAGAEGSPLDTCIDDTEELTLSYEQGKSFCIEYGVIEPGATSSVEYQLLLDGVDKTWRNMDTERKISGFNLAPGTYKLHIRANNSSEDWDNCKVKTITIRVRPPFFRSVWAYMLYIIALLLIGYIVYRISSSRIRERQAVKIAQMEKEQLKQLDQTKFEFFTSVSHELKTPLSLIAAPLKVLSKQGMSSDSRKNLDIALKNTRKLDVLINELVTFNKIETDNFPFYVQKGNPLEFIRLNTLSFREIASDKNLNLSVECEDNGEEVWFSPSYVEHILNNLLSNAMKFTPEKGSVGVTASIVPDDDGGFTYLKMTVSDTGIGIAPEEHENIFGRYYQTKRGFNVNHNGWGIGLALVKKLTEVHRGNITLTSELGKGTRFTVMLNTSSDAFPQSCYITDDKVIVPITEYKFSQSMLDLADNVVTAGEDNTAEEGKMTLLFVEDNDDLLSFLSSYFSRNYNVITAHDGKEALKLTRENDIQMVVSDIMMPEMSGIELCRTLKGDMHTSHIPVILLTAKSEPDDVVEGYRSGAEAYVSKPFEPQILELQIKNIITLLRDRRREILNSADMDATGATLTQLDRQFINDINNLVEENIGNSDFSISDITQCLGMSRSLLHVKMRSLCDMSMGDYIRKKRLDYACHMLHETRSVAETAYKAGFTDPNYFSKVFKKHIGVNPTEYIANNLD